MKRKALLTVILLLAFFEPRAKTAAGTQSLPQVEPVIRIGLNQDAAAVNIPPGSGAA